MKLFRSLSLLILCLIPITALATQCFYVGENYFCVPPINSGSINWTSLNQDIQRGGINWSSLSKDIKSTSINWLDIKNLEIQQYGINWTSIPNYSDGKTLKARTGATYGVNWE